SGGEPGRFDPRDKMRRLLLTLLVWGGCMAQDMAHDMSETEQQALNQALSEAGSSPIELVRALETHLAKFPKSPKREELERVLLKAAMENRDDRRIILYGERVLGREQDDLQALDRVARALLASDAKETSERALKYAKRYEQLVTEMRSKPADPRLGSQWQEELDRGVARALSLEARATGNLGSPDQAILLAKQAYSAYPSTEAAREVGRWLARSGKENEALQYLADAFVLTDPRNGD